MPFLSLKSLQNIIVGHFGRNAGMTIPLLATAILLAGCSGNSAPPNDSFGAYNGAGGAQRASDFSRYSTSPASVLTPLLFSGLEGGLLAPPLEVGPGRTLLLSRNDSVAMLALAFRDSVYWRYRFPRDQHPMPWLAADSAGVIYAATSRGLVRAFSPEGKPLWENAMPADTGSGIQVPSPPLALPEGVVVGDSRGALVRFDRAGKVRWSIRRGLSLSGMFAADPAIGIVVGGTHNDYELVDTLMVIDPATGGTRWSVPVTEGRIVQGPVIAGELIVLGTVRVRPEDGQREPSLAAYTRDGKPAWRARLPLIPRGISADNGGNLYVACSGVAEQAIGGAVLSYDGKGTKRWEVNLESGIPAAPVVSAEWVYFISRRDGRTGLFTYTRDGIFNRFLSIDLLPDVRAHGMVSSFGELMLAGLDQPVVLRGE